ncbi:hypothetical protein CPB85DRAFT_606797 [Mucidula mucida]|nr:hypothetical protein CPB85DRAFT_606797 [Mucidula mucida]
MAACLSHPRFRTAANARSTAVCTLLIVFRILRVSGPRARTYRGYWWSLPPYTPFPISYTSVILMGRICPMRI